MGVHRGPGSVRTPPLTLLTTATDAVHHRCITRKPSGAVPQDHGFRTNRMVKRTMPIRRTVERRIRLRGLLKENPAFAGFSHSTVWRPASPVHHEAGKGGARRLVSRAASVAKPLRKPNRASRIAPVKKLRKAIAYMGATSRRVRSGRSTFGCWTCGSPFSGGVRSTHGSRAFGQGGPIHERRRASSLTASERDPHSFFVIKTRSAMHFSRPSCSEVNVRTCRSSETPRRDCAWLARPR